MAMEEILAIIFIFGTPVFLAAVITGGVLLNRHLKQTHENKQRALYERVVLEKMDVIKTAVAMGYSQQELANLDRRLEQLIGAEQLQALQHGQAVQLKAGPELRAVELDSELRRLQMAARELEP
jgi:hypothetical protein